MLGMDPDVLAALIEKYANPPSEDLRLDYADRRASLLRMADDLGVSVEGVRPRRDARFDDER